MDATVTLANDMKREMKERNLFQLTRVCPDHPAGLIRASLVGSKGHLRMACTVSGCSYRMME